MRLNSCLRVYKNVWGRNRFDQLYEVRVAYRVEPRKSQKTLNANENAIEGDLGHGAVAHSYVGAVIADKVGLTYQEAGSFAIEGALVA